MGYRYPKTKRGIITFNKIVDASDYVFYKSGYYNASINEITTKAEVALGSFYTYFDSKYSVYKYLLDRYSHEIRSSIFEKLRDGMTRKQQERAGIKAFLMYVVENPQCYNIIWESLYIDQDLFLNYYQTFADKYVENLKKAEEKGEIIKGYNLEVLAFLLMGATNFIGLRYIKFSKYLDVQAQKKLEERIDKVVDEVILFLENGYFRR